jgi:hypothetical protein
MITLMQTGWTDDRSEKECGPFRELPNLMRGRVQMANMKILLVEDNKFLRSAAERAMVRAGYEVTSGGQRRGPAPGARKAA